MIFSVLKHHYTPFLWAISWLTIANIDNEVCSDLLKPFWIPTWLPEIFTHWFFTAGASGRFQFSISQKTHRNCL